MIVFGVYIFDGDYDEMVALVADEALVPAWVDAAEQVIASRQASHDRGGAGFVYPGTTRVDRIPVQDSPPGPDVLERHRY